MVYIAVCCRQFISVDSMYWSNDMSKSANSMTLKAKWITYLDVSIYTPLLCESLREKSQSMRIRIMSRQAETHYLYFVPNENVDVVEVIDLSSSVVISSSHIWSIPYSKTKQVKLAL